MGPNPQFKPITSTDRPSNSVATVSISPPVKVFPVSSKVTLAIIGKSEFSFAASIAAFISYKSDIVSIIIRSTPFPATTISSKTLYASSKLRSPIGFISLPVGPMSNATYEPFFLSAAFLAIFTACFIYSVVLS